MIFASVLLLVANLADEVMSKIGFSFGFVEKGKSPKLVGMDCVWSWKWLVCITLIFLLFANRRKPERRWFLTKTILITAVVVLVTQLYHASQILLVQYCEQIVSFLSVREETRLTRFVLWVINLYWGLPGQS